MLVVGHTTRQQGSIKLLVDQILHHGQDKGLRSRLANPVQRRWINLFLDWATTGSQLLQVCPLRNYPVHVIKVAFERLVTRLIPVDVKANRQWPGTGNYRGWQSWRRWHNR